MPNRRDWVVQLVTQIVKDQPTAEMVVDRLTEEGLLHLGYGNADVDNIVVAFSDTFGTTKVSRADRFSAHRLARKYGSQSVVGIIKLLAEHNTERYAPVVGSIAQLETKWVSVLHFLRNLKGEEIIDA
jgi:hypothetical protein